ncbi:prothymosin alpha [Phyllostomus discolor]|uniref:Prothymosin alpha n=1 Tax=Phyllostomus discolor TaxID=89673 RepID=A0A834EIQ9_9CHIR|nr:prothymosin alpha [Phyllostomus discolor]
MWIAPVALCQAAETDPAACHPGKSCCREISLRNCRPRFLVVLLLPLQVRRRMEMKMRRLRQLRANGQLKMTRMTMLTPRSRRPMRMTRQQKRKS